MKKRAFALAVVLAVALSLASTVHAQKEITVIGPGSARAALEKLLPGFEEKTGYKVISTIGTGVGTKKQIIQGEAFDVPIMQWPLDEVLASGNVVVASRTPIVTVSAAVFIRKGTAKPDISTPGAVKRMLLAAKSVAYPDPAIGAAVGLSINETLRKLGIFEQVQAKSTLKTTGGACMALVASGEVEIGMTFLSEITDPGVELVGVLPLEISKPTALVGFVSTRAKDPQAAKALLEYLSSADKVEIYRALGYNPGG